MKRFPSIADLTPERFEREVKAWLESGAEQLSDFKATHQEVMRGSDGEYTIDVTARFKAFGGSEFLVLVECKKHKNPVKREVVQVIRDKQISIGAHKALVVSTTSFQKGAIEYASKHGIGLIQIVSGVARYIQNSAGRQRPDIPEHADDYIGLFYGPNPDNRLFLPQLISSRWNYEFALFLRSVGSQVA